VTERAVWQVAAGEANRSYSDVFIRSGVALIGPGDAGPWRPSLDDDVFGGGFVRRFAGELAVGDILLLRTGISTVQAVGLVSSDYCYLPQFDDVNGWDLQHARRVRWFQLPDPYDFGKPVFGASPTRISRVADPDIIDYADRFVASPPVHWQSEPLPPLPSEDPALDEIPDALRDLAAQVRDLADLYWDRDRFGDHPMEDELVAHYVVPFLRALGWKVEQIGIKWRWVDVAVFRGLPRTPDNCQFILEAKRLGAGVEGALEQGRGYLDMLGITRDVVVTDGVRYRMYAGGQDFAPVAYANLARLKLPALDLFARLSRV
jgi:hypothetical protein